MSRNKGQTGTVYRVVARSALGDRYAPAFDGMRVESAGGRTVLTGEVEDLSQLYDVLERINDLGLQLLSVQALFEEAP
jgi:outer membrane PBP1 activator LpoA protein